MTDRVEFALRQWQRIRPKTGDVPKNLSIKAISSWLERDVCTICAELIARPDFRLFARWSPDAMLTESQSKERILVEEIETALLDTASYLAGFASRPSVQRKLVRERVTRTAHAGTQSQTASDSRGSSSTNENAAKGRVRSKVLEQPAARHESKVASLQRELQIIASRPWHDLVSAHDYFSSTANLNLVDPAIWHGPNHRVVSVAEFLPFCEPRLRLPGDFITRCMFIRIDYWRSVLQEANVTLQTALRSQPLDSKGRQSLVRASLNVSAPLEKLRSMCLDGKNSRQRDAAMALVQVYAAYHPAADLSWLGAAETAKSTAVQLRYRIEKHAEIDIAEQVALSLTEMSGLYRTEIDAELLIAEKAKSHALCLIGGQGRRDGYWQGELLKANWNKQSRAWTLLFAIAEGAKHRTRVGNDTDLGISLKDARSDLKSVLPDDLFKYIKIKRYEHWLELPAHEVFVAEFDRSVRLIETE